MAASLTMVAGRLCALKLEIREGRPLVDGVYVNGQGPWRFMLDTGSNVNLIESRLAAASAMDTGFRINLVSSLGSAPLPGSDGNQIELGSASAGDQKFLYSDLAAIHRVFPDVRGVLGQWFLGGFDYTLDLRRGRLDFGKQTHKGTYAPFTLRNGRASVATSLGELVLDSGAAQLTLFGAMGAHWGAAFMRTVTASGFVGIVPSALAIGGRNIWQGQAIAISDRAEPGVAGLLPVGLFRLVYVCNSERYMVFD